MDRRNVLLSIVIVGGGLIGLAPSTNEARQQRITVPRPLPPDSYSRPPDASFDRWLTGDPEPELAIVDPQITYIHSAAATTRISGIVPLQKLYDGFRGTPLFDSYDIMDPHVRTSGTTAVLTYRLTRRRAAATDHWNATRVYEQQTSGWRVIHSHWSEVKERQP